MKRLIPLLAIAASACTAPLPSPKGRELTDKEVRDYYDRLGTSTVYYRDPRTGECFAQPGGPGYPSSWCECTDAVKRLIVNEQQATAAEGAP